MFTVIHFIKEAVPQATQNSDDSIKEHQSQELKGRRERVGRGRGEEKKKEKEKLLRRSKSQLCLTAMRLTPQMEKNMQSSKEDYKCSQVLISRVLLWEQ